jgi:hypothetical protein
VPAVTVPESVMPVPAARLIAVPVPGLPARLDPAAWLIAPPVDSVRAEAVLATLAPAVSEMPSALLKLIEVPAVMAPAGGAARGRPHDRKTAGSRGERADRKA